MNLKQSLLIAVTLSVFSIVAWELFWRSQGYYPTLNDEKALWALERKTVASATTDDFIILGSSRAFFDIQKEAWKEQTGKYPIQLASQGATPLPLFHDIVTNTDFTGTVVMGVTPGLFFSTTFPQATPWNWSQTRVDYFKNQTYAQKLNYQISAPLQEHLAFMSADELLWTDDIDLKTLLKRIEFGKRLKEPKMPPFKNFGDVSIPRNITASNRTVTDTAFANSIIKVWHFFGKGAPAPDKESTIAYFLEDLKKFKARNGNVILLRCPSSGGVRMGENMALPRAAFWDDLVKQANIPSYHFEDYEALKSLKCPEESHLSKEDAEYFTRELVKIMKADGALSTSKTN